MWRVDGNILESYSLNEFAMRDVENSRFVVGTGIYSNKHLSLVPQCFRALLIVRNPPRQSGIHRTLFGGFDVPQVNKFNLHVVCLSVSQYKVCVN
jgi:hypothetical protein